jgi:hypothetical protein
MLDRQREPLMYIDSRRCEIWEWSDHTLYEDLPESTGEAGKPES